MRDTNRLRSILEQIQEATKDVPEANCAIAHSLAREALSVPEEAPQSKPERSEEFEDLLVAAEAHLAVHPCTPKPCQPELSLKAALDAFGVRQMPATVKCPKCGNLRLRAGGACGPCSESWFARYGSDADAKLVREQFARPRLFCTKCGYHGPEQRHPGCGYIAMSLDGEPEVVGRPVPEEAGPERIGRRTEYEWGEAIGSPGGSEGFGGDGDALIAAAFRSPVPEPARMSREEAEIRGAEAILRNDGFDPKLHPPMGSERGGMALMRARAVLTALGFPGEPKAGVEKIAGKTREEWERDTYMQYPDTQALLAAAFRALTAESRLERAEKVLTRAVDLLDCWSYNPKSSFYRACPDKNQQRCPNCLVSMDARSYFTEEKRG